MKQEKALSPDEDSNLGENLHLQLTLAVLTKPCRKSLRLAMFVSMQG